MHVTQRAMNTHNALYAKVNGRKAASTEFYVGEKVCIRRKKDTFQKGFKSNWAEEVFTIASVKATKLPTYYQGYAERANLSCGNVTVTRSIRTIN